MTHKSFFPQPTNFLWGGRLAHRVALGLLALDFNFKKELTI